MTLNFACECGISFVTDEARFPIYCRCGRVAETSDSPLVSAGEQALPVSRLMNAHVVDRCRYRGSCTRLVDCPTCRGSVKVKAFACDVHGECTVGKQLEGVKSCAKCADKTPLAIATAASATPVARPPIPTVSKLAIVTSFFNPHRGQRRVSIYSRFAEAIRNQGLPLFCMEGMFSGSPQVDSTWQVAIDPEAVFWHKENLLNIAIERLPDEFDAVAWIDADVIYEDTDIGNKIIDALSRDPIVQPWSQIRYLGPDDTPISTWRSSMSLYNSTRPKPDADPRHSYPGMAWAASRETLVKIGGIYDRCITGGGDVAWSAGVWGDKQPLYGKQWSNALVEDSVRWGESVTQLTGGHVGVVAARAEHLYHGSLHNRQYVARNAIFGQVNFDPNRHVEVAGNGTLRWSKHAPDIMRTSIAEYMHNRKEDE